MEDKNHTKTKEFVEEKAKLDSVIAEVKQSRDFLTKRLKDIGADNLDRLQDLRSDPETGTDFQMLLEQLHEKNEAFNLKDKYKRLEEYGYLVNNPYFARVDVYDPKEKDTKQLYIGKFGFTTDAPVVTDWRASIASIYYRYRFPQKNVKYKTEQGEVTCDLTLKRTFEIYDGSLVKLYNNDIQFDENDIIVDKIEKRTGGVLEDIIETIQKDQMDIIEADPRQICIVQGCVGSGKSTVAIHKLAHIFFHFSNYIRPEKSILVVKNQILVGYLSTLFPKLGIFDINYKSFRDLVVNAIFREEMNIQVDLDVAQDTSSFPLERIESIYGHLDLIHALYEQKIKEAFNDPDLESYGGYKYSSNATPFQNLDDILEDLNEEIETQKESLKEDSHSLRAVFHKENIKNLRKATRRINDIKYSLRHQVFSDVLKSFKINVNRKLDYQETLIFILIFSKLIGFKKFQPYEYCVIDEGQDFSLLEYAVLNSFVLRGRFGIFGDLNQSVESDGIIDWNSIQHVIPEIKTAHVFSLETNYRSTKPIIDLANKILGKYSQKYLPKSINRKGEEPIIAKFEHRNDMIRAFLEKFKSDLKNIDKSIGVICYSKDDFETIRAFLSKQREQQNINILEKSKKVNYIPKGIYLMMAEDCKGLEFSKVFVLDLNLDKLQNALEARQAFVAVTRAMNHLEVYGIK